MFIDALLTVAALTFALYVYDLAVSLAGFLPLRSPPPPVRDAELPTFACVVCAHNEEQVIAGIVESLSRTNYPENKRRIFVVADNCTDRTAEVARRAGAEVLERHDPHKRTKGYALQWAMDQLIEMQERTGGLDALCVFDADNAVRRDFFHVVAGHLHSGDRAIQVYLDTKNPDESWVTRSIALAYHVSNRFWLRARERLGLPTTLGGTGFCLDWRLVKEYRWDPGSLSEDLELAVKLTLAGIRVAFSPHTRIYDEKPVRLWPSIRQRMRWMQGHNDVASRWVPRALWHALRYGSWAALDVALYLLQPLRVLVAFSAFVVLATAAIALPSESHLADSFHFTWPSLALACGIFVVYPLCVAAAEGVLWPALRVAPLFFLFSFSWIPAIALGLLRMKNRTWLHTAHRDGRAGAGRWLEDSGQELAASADVAGELMGSPVVAPSVPPPG
jgi:cellulose synthase/poly-beta-1,6-N-acetylglucosamine synthase-like glycosyltransferase